MSSLRTFPGASVTQQDSKLWLYLYEDALCRLLWTNRSCRKLSGNVRSSISFCVAPVSFLSRWDATHKLSLFSMFAPQFLAVIDISYLYLLICLWFVCATRAFFNKTCISVCSAGCGRTGAICAIDYTWNLLKAGVCSTPTPAHTF